MAARNQRAPRHRAGAFARLVIIESPLAAKTEDGLAANIAYARACLRHSLLQGEAPMASHLLYAQPGVLRDGEPGERELGIAAGLAWGRVVEATIVYTDRGISPGMARGIRDAEAAGRPVEYRKLRPPLTPL